MFKKPQITEVVTDMRSLSIYLRADKKFGKTTLFRDVILEKFGDPSKGLLIGVGNEVGYKILDNLNATQIESWEDLNELTEWLITTKGKEHNIEMVAFDTVDELMPILEQGIIKMSVKETGKPCKSFNAAFGGYGEPRKKLMKLIRDYFKKLNKTGFSPMIIGHTKVKSIKEKGSQDDGYQILSSNISNDCEAVFADVFDCVLTGCVDRENKDGGVSTATRKLYLRGDGFIDAGCRFANNSVPEYIEFNDFNNAKTFIDTLEEGLKNSRSTEISDKEFKVKQEEEVKEIKEKAKEYIEEETSINADENHELIEKIKANLKSIDVKEMKKIMTEYNFESFGEPETIKTEALEKIVALIK